MEESQSGDAVLQYKIGAAAGDSRRARVDSPCFLSYNDSGNAKHEAIGVPLVYGKEDRHDH